ncbi:hypothetical protein DAEQUDRAFT_720057 [Daedalea quercina L-15889]|uniref:Chalcone isomerase domain-containing protein n=1 Tax=Daedalea quercina L-15889 TaxID=1314783 RepID=A0A165UGG2_9APHY|nr:hypothetical protein DAEQUDRAFT_720057 [Daedalea quercina L-15889]
MLAAIHARTAAWLAVSCRGSSAVSRALHTDAAIYSSRPRQARRLFWYSALAIAATTALGSTIRLDAPSPEGSGQGTELDPATSIAFPKTLRIPSKTPLPEFSLVGLGVRTVSFLGIKVYSVGFYADLANSSLNIPKTASPDEKIEYIIRNTACVLRIIPTRSTSYSHLRDGFIRALQTRLMLSKQRQSLSAEEELAIQSPLRKFKSMFPSTPLAKHAPLDVLLTAPSSQPRSLIVRDLGSVQSDWLATEFVLAYFEGDGLSPPLKKTVVEKLESFGS